MIEDLTEALRGMIKMIFHSLLWLVISLIVLALFTVIASLFYTAIYWFYILITESDTFWLEVRIWGKR